MGSGKGGVKELEAFIKRLEKLEKDVPEILNELAAHEGEVLVGMVKRRTPFISGDLRRNFHSYILPRLSANPVTVKVVNNLEYASYVENGHRKRRRKDGTRPSGWVPGRFMLRTSVQQYKENVMRGNISRFLEKKLREYFNG